MKKTISLILAIAMTLSFTIPLSSCTKKGKRPTKNIVYEISDDGTYAEVTGFRGHMSEIVIASEYKNLPVTKIADGAFRMNPWITSVFIPDSVTSIGNEGFRECIHLESITIPNSVTNIGNDAFQGCTGLTNITIPNGVTNIGNDAFWGCTGLTSITIPNGVTSIGDGAFIACTSLTSINIPNSVTNIGREAFSNCTSLTSATISNRVTSIGDHTFYGCKSLANITIPNSVTNIGNDAFIGCSNLTSINIPNSVTSIGQRAFDSCTNLTVDERNTAYHIENNCLIETGSKTLIAGFNNSVIPTDGSVTSIGESAFEGCSSLTSINIPDSVTSIGQRAFVSCTNLTSITVDEHNTVYHSEGNCLIETNSKTLIAGFNNSVIPTDGSVTSIGESAFEGCTSLTSITIPDSVTKIADYAFQNCTSLASINYNGTTKLWNRHVMKGPFWDSNTGTYTVYCTNSNITK